MQQINETRDSNKTDRQTENNVAAACNKSMKDRQIESLNRY